MTKKLLLAATAMTVLGFAGAANAVDITTARVAGITVYDATRPAADRASPYGLASQVTVPVAGLSTPASAVGVETDVLVALSAGAGALAPGNYVMTFTYTGISGFVSTPSLVLTGAAGCTPSAVLSTGGTATSQTVSYIVGVDVACTTNPTFRLTAPFKIASAGSVTVQASLTQGGLPVDNSPTATRTLVQSRSAYTASVSGAVDGKGGATDTPVNAADNADFPTQLALGTGSTPFQAFRGTAEFDNVIGALGYVSVADTYADLSKTPLPTPAMDVTVTGNFAGLTPTLATNDLGAGVVAATTVTASAATFAAVPAGRYNVLVAPTSAAANAPQLAGGAYTATFSSASSAPLAAGAISASGALETIGLQGTNFVAPWVQSANPNFNTVLRLSNSGAATGPVTLSLTSPAATPAATTCGAAQLAKLASIPANGELSINSTDLTTCFGAFTRGDVRVTVQSQSTSITAKLRIVNPGNVVTEQSLGAISTGVATVN
nr:hypothetical protein [Brevundimonas diminuta]